jgi:hypothetical protein
VTGPTVFDAWETRAAVRRQTREWSDCEIWWMGLTGRNDPRLRNLELPDYPHVTLSELIIASRRLRSPEEQAQFDAWCLARETADALLEDAPLGLHAVQIIPQQIWNQLGRFDQTHLESRAMNRAGGRGSDGFTYLEVCHADHNLATLQLTRR